MISTKNDKIFFENMLKFNKEGDTNESISCNNIYYFIIQINKKHKKNKQIYQMQINTFNFNSLYKPKECIITKTELKFYKILLEISKELDLILFSQVALYSIIGTKYNDKDSFYKICSKSIDFVLVNKNTCKVVTAIELDDFTHILLYERQERDKFINKLFRDLNILLLRFEVEPEYDKEKIKNKIKECIKEC